MKNKIIAIILARKGSKSIKNKNLLKINNKPLIGWTIDQCKKSKLISQVWLSSDSQKILNYGIKKKINIIKRPIEFADDKASSESAWIHAIKHIEEKKIKFDTIVAPQATSPIRGKNDFDNAIKVFFSKKYDTLFSCNVIKDFFVWKKIKNKLIPNYDYKNRKPRQLIDPLLLENGSFFIFDKKKFMNFKCRMFGNIGYFVQDSSKSFQLDEPDDLYIIKKLLK